MSKYIVSFFILHSSFANAVDIYNCNPPSETVGHCASNLPYPSASVTKNFRWKDNNNT